MKKTVPLLLPIFLLASCGGALDSSQAASSSSSISSSSSSNASSESSSSSSSSSVSLTEEERIVEALKRIKESSNYTLEYSYQGQSYVSYYTKNYIYFSETNLGYINLESFDSSIGDTLVYNYYFDSEDKFTLAYPHEEKIVSCQSFNYLANLKAVPSTLEGEDGHYYSDNKNLINSLANTLGYYEDAENGTFTRVRLESTDIDSFSFALQTIDYDSFEYVDVVDASGTIFNIGETAIAACDEYIADFEIPEFPLSSEKIVKLNLIDDNDVISVDSQIYISSSTTGDKTLIDSFSYDRSSSRVHTVEGGNEEYFKNGNGKVLKEGINALNQVATMPIGEYYLFEEEYPLAYNLLLNDLNAFRSTNSQDNQYQYFGFNGEQIYKNFSYIDVNSQPESLFLTIEEDALELTATFPEMGVQNGATIDYFKIQIVSTLVSDRKIPTLMPLEDANFELQDKINHLNGNENFIANSYDTRTNEREKNTYLVDDLLIFEQKELTFSGTVSSYVTGYKKETDGVQRFLIDKNGVAKENGYLKADGLLSDFVGMHVSTNIFNKIDTTTYTLNPLVLKSVSDSLILGNEGNNLLIDTFEMTVDDQHITQISYDYDDGLFQQGSEIVEYRYENLEIPQEILTKIEQMTDFVEPTSWKDESLEIHEKLVSLFGEEVATTIPYLYNEETYCQFESTLLYDTITISSSSETVNDDEYYANYKDILTKQGYELDLTPDLPGAEIYTKDNIEIRLAKDLTGGIFISKLA